MEIHTNIHPTKGKSASDLDSQIRQTFMHAVNDGQLNIVWNDAQTKAAVDIEIITVESGEELAKLLGLLGGGAEIRKAA